MSEFAENIESPCIYFKSLHLKNIKGFKGEQEIDLSNGDSKPSKWTVILGNNNTGKTTILRVISTISFPSINGALRRKNNIFISQNTREDFNRNRIKKINKAEGDFRDILYDTRDGSFFKYSRKNKSESIDLQLIKQFILPPNNNLSFGLDLFTSASFQYSLYMFKGGYNFSEKKNSIIEKDVLDAKIWNTFKHNPYEYLEIFCYGVNRKMSETQLSNDNDIFDNLSGIFQGENQLLNVEEWLLQLVFAVKSKVKNASKVLSKVEEIIKGELLPDVKDFKVFTDEEFQSSILFQTDYGWIRLKDLGYGYQATLAWVMDLAKRMFDRYPNSANPLAESAVVLVDEIDLHLHPEWQRKIISYLSNIFKNTQFIVTAHSPLIIQSAENVNLVMLEKDGDHINIRQQFGSFKGWTVDEILDELMGMNDKTMSDTYLQLMKQFDEALDEDNYEKAQAAYDGLDKILHPSSSQRKILRIQMSSLAPIEA